jgi:thiamine-monophosphate kinase
MTRLRDLGELELIKSLLPYLTRGGEGLLIGPGQDDAAAWREPDGSVTVATCDTFVEGVHFDFGWLEPLDVGWRAVALTVSDLAAKGAQPTYGLVSLSAPPAWEQARVVAIYEGLAQAAERCGLKLVGGDTSSTPGPSSLTVMALGRATTTVLSRSAARPGWGVAVTGRLGAAAAGLAAARAGKPLEEEWRAALRRPSPRLAEGRHLAGFGLCCGDVSDGLLREMDKFAAAAGTGSRLNLEAIPRAEGVDALTALTSGEEVELVCTGPEEVIGRAARDLGGELTLVGVLTEEPDVVVLDAGGARLELPQRGYDHFA